MISPEDSIAVKRNLRVVHQLQQTDKLKQFNASTQHELDTVVAPLMSARVLRDKHATSLDKLMAITQRCFVQQAS
ncbi:hypothetical protein P4S73_25150 [Paraglaciecola sp. Hal342]